jgi:hypothetical protein
MPVVTIPVPKPPRSAYDPNRPVSSLLVSHIERLQRVVLEGIQTEAQAAEYIRALMRRVKHVHPHVEPRHHGRRRTSAKQRGRTRAKTTTRSAAPARGRARTGKRKQAR